MAIVNENYLFLYCEWIDDELVKRSCPSAEKITTGVSEDKAVRFVAYEDDKGNPYEGGCCAVKAPDKLMYGTVWKIDWQDLQDLESIMDVANGRYTRLYQAVKGDDNKAYACISHSIKNPVDFNSHPSQAYLEHMLKGARENNFPAEYIASLEALA